MLKINDVFVKCNNCGNKMIVPCDNFEVYSGSYERSMGAETEFEYCYEFNCPCGQTISISIRAYEYPQGALSYSSNNISGGTFIAEPSCEVLFEEDYYIDEDEAIHLADPIDSLKMRIRNMSSDDFEQFVSTYFQGLGYDTYVTQKTRDGGFDVLCKKEQPFKMVLLVECKHYSAGNNVGVRIVRNLLGVHFSEKANKSIIITTSSFTAPAIAFANNQKTTLELVDFDQFIDWIKNSNK